MGITVPIYSTHTPNIVLLQFVSIVAFCSTKKKLNAISPTFLSRIFLGSIFRGASYGVCVCVSVLAKAQWYWCSMSDWAICVVLNRNLLERSAIHPFMALLKSCQYKRPSSTAKPVLFSTSSFFLFFPLFPIANIDLQINVSFKRNKYMQTGLRGRTIGKRDIYLQWQCWRKPSSGNWINKLIYFWFGSIADGGPVSPG